MKIFNSIDWEEAEAAYRSTLYNPLSGYLGSIPLGGKQCLRLEEAWSDTFGIKHAIAVNSGTSGLLAACMAIEIEHGDEVIVSPYTMSATAAVPKMLGAKLVWADIEPDTFTIDPVEVSNLITARTKAVIATNLFGHPAYLHELYDICNSHGIYLIEDNAQAIFAKEHGVYTGTIGHIGVFSLNVHKHLQVGEGGICVTNSDMLATKLREAMNHGEMRGGILGLNLRMTEVTASMACEQLKKAPQIMTSRIHFAKRLTYHTLDKIIRFPVVRKDCTHSYYCWAGLLDSEPKGDLPAPFKRGYLHPLYSLPAFATKPSISLPVVEEIERKIVLVEVCSIDPSDDEIVKMVEDLARVL
jgi:perosamine synthetase